MYPRPGSPLLPEILRPFVGQELVPAALVRRFHLHNRTQVGDLDTQVSATHTAEALAELGEVVIEAVQHARLIERANRVAAVRRSVALTDLELSRRAQNALTWAGLTDGERVLPMSVSQLAAAKGVGPRVLLEVLTEVERARAMRLEPAIGEPATTGARPRASRAVASAVRPLLSRRWAPKVYRDDPRLGPAVVALHPAARSAREAGELLEQMLPASPNQTRQITTRVRDLVARADGMRLLSLEDELREVVTAVMGSGPSRDVVEARFGFGGSAPSTLAVAGQHGGVTRERARQLAARFRQSISRGSRVWLPVFDRAIGVVAAKTPGSAKAIEQLLKEDGVSAHAFSIESIKQAADVFGRDTQFIYDRDTQTLLHEGAAGHGQIASAARKLVSHWGATTIDAVKSLVEESGAKTDASFIATVLQGVPGFGWLDNERQWFWIRGVARNRLLNQIEKIMSVAGSIDVSDLRGGVGRHHRMVGFRPPREVLARLCEDSGLYNRQGTRVVGGPDLPDWRSILAENERVLVEVLFEHGPVMRKDELVDLAVQHGLNRNSVTVYLTYSPVLERYAPGVWGLRGAAVTAGEIKSLIPPRVRHQVLQDQGWTTDGRVWVGYRLSPAALESGVLGTPGVLRDVAHGPFPLYAESGNAVGTLVIEQNMWGLSPYFRRWGAEPGDYIVIALDLSRRKATIYLGDEELLLRYQQAE